MEHLRAFGSGYFELALVSAWGLRLAGDAYARKGCHARGDWILDCVFVCVYVATSDRAAKFGIVGHSIFTSS